MNQYFKQGFEKTAVTRMVKAFRSGQIGLPSVAKASKKLNLKPRELKHLGTGSEGTAHLVTHPKAGVAVQKTYNTTSPLYNPKMIAEKNRIAKQNPDLFAKYLGRKKGKPVTYHEYIPGKPQAGKAGSDVDMARRARKAGIRLQGQNMFGPMSLSPTKIEGGYATGLLPSKGAKTKVLNKIDKIKMERMKAKGKETIVGDVHGGNIGVTDKGQMKILDFIPGKSMGEQALATSAKANIKALGRAAKKGKLSQHPIETLNTRLRQGAEGPVGDIMARAHRGGFKSQVYRG